MSTASIVSLDEFLSSDQYARCEYDSGVVTEKPLPGWNHSELCGWIIALLLHLFPHYKVGPKVRARLSQEQWRLPDIAVALREDTPRTKYALTPPHLCIEVLSQEDTPEKMFEKCRHYHRWGVAHCWIFDPESRRCWQFDRNTSPALREDLIAAGDIRLSVPEIFSCLDPGFIPHFPAH